ncbi:MAG: hypothetical protein U5R48_17465 [Gammaproteobacteria bacterium]|nr:hypothetical protein [Gammaproteobacteria bacterium]
MRRTRLTESFGFEDYLADNAAELVPMFAVSPDGPAAHVPARPGCPGAGGRLAASSPLGPGPRGGE